MFSRCIGVFWCRLFVIVAFIWLIYLAVKLLSGKCVHCALQLAKSQGNVFITDAIMSTLMCATRSVYSWDIIVQKVGKKLFFDKRDESEFG